MTDRTMVLCRKLAHIFRSGVPGFAAITSGTSSLLHLSRTSWRGFIKLMASMSAIDSGAIFSSDGDSHRAWGGVVRGSGVSGAGGL